MFFSKLANFYSRRKLRRLRRTLLGYRRMSRISGFRQYRELLGLISSSAFPFIQSSCPEKYYGAAHPHAEPAIRQFLLRLIGPNFHDSVCRWYATSTPIVHPLPHHWRTLIEKSGIDVNHRKSSWLFKLFIIRIIVRNIFACLSFFYKSIFRTASNLKVEKYIFFANLRDYNLPRNFSKSDGGTEGDSTFDVCSWFYANYYSKQTLNAIGHDTSTKPYEFRGISVRNIAYPFYLLTGIRTRMRFLIWCCWALSHALIKCLVGQWWHGLLLYEVILAKAVSLVDRRNLATGYLFHYSGLKFRPIWTYAAEKLGSDVLVYFYGTYAQPLSRKAKEAEIFEYGDITWSKILVWTETHKKQILSVNNLKHDNIHVVGPIWFADSELKLPDNYSNAVAVFPVAPMRSAYYRGTSTLTDWNLTFPNLHRDFLENIAEVLSEMNFFLFIKLKRDLGSLERKSSAQLYRNLGSHKNIQFIDTSVSPFRLTRNVVASISIPFTSAALCSTNREFPSIYYDPTGWIDKSDSAANGVPIVSGVKELRAWCASLRIF